MGVAALQPDRRERRAAAAAGGRRRHRRRARAVARRRSRRRVAGPRPLRRRDPAPEAASATPCILAHNYQTPEIFHGVADFVGDSLGLAQQAAKTDAEVIVLCGVHFMAETSKILSPGEDRADPRPRAPAARSPPRSPAPTCASCASAIPGVPVVTYVNTSAEVKAESDICCTSANAVEVVESLGVPSVIFLPDEYLGSWVATQTEVEIDPLEGPLRGARALHRRRDPRASRDADPGVYVLAHPECPPDVLAEADFVGSTAGMIRDVGAGRPPARGDDHRVLDERQRRRRASRRSSSCGRATSART